MSPKRIVDGEGLWQSDKVALLPEWIKPEYANLIPLAMANGVFEASDRLVWSKVYTYNRPEIDLGKVTEILTSLERVKLLFRWNDETGKTWGYWVGIDKAGRLPSASRQNKKHERTGPQPPPEELRQFLAMESKHSVDGQPLASQRPTDGEVGFGSGFGSGLGYGTGKTPLSEVSPSDEKRGEVDAIPPPYPPLQKSDVREQGETLQAANQLANLLKAQILSNKADTKITQSQLRGWVKTAERMIRLDLRSPERIKALILWATRDEFWKTNILSMDKLREKFDQLDMKCGTASPAGRKNLTDLSAMDYAAFPEHMVTVDDEEAAICQRD